MRMRNILPRQIVKRGEKVWIVRIPQDLRRAHDVTRREFGSDKKAAEAFAESLKRARTSVGAEFFKLTPAAQNAVLDVLRRVGVDGLLQAVNEWERLAVLERKTVAAGMEEYLASARQSGVRKHSYAAIKCYCKSFSDRFGHELISDIGAKDIQDWMENPGWGIMARRSAYVRMQVFFKFSKNRKWTRENPLLTLSRPKVPYRAKKILTPVQWATILNVFQRRDPELLAVLCLVLFGGLRHSEALRA